MLSDKAQKLGSEPAFPYTVKEGDEVWSGGATKREWFAALAMQSISEGNAPLHIAECARMIGQKPEDYESEMFYFQVQAKMALRKADALLEALVKDEP